MTGEQKTSHQTVYGVSTLPCDQADAARLLEFNQQQWTIENGVFYARNETFGEDRSRTASSTNISASLRTGASITVGVW